MFRAYLPPFIIAAIISGGLTYYVKSLALKFNYVDLPAPRKIHHKPIPRLGGVAIVGTFLIVLFAYIFASKRLTFGFEKIWFMDQRIFGLIVGLIILTLVGLVDDIRGVKAWKKLIWYIVAAAIAVGSGISISYLRLPFGSHLELSGVIYNLTVSGHNFSLIWGDLLALFWIVLLINTINFLDGLDGLASGITLITCIVVFFLAISLGQDANSLLAILIAGIAFGFLPWNFNPAKIFMGDSGSMALGFLLGVLSIISGGKLATAFLVLGIPVLDVGWVLVRRLFSRRSPFEADKGHFHHRLLTAGLSQKQAVITLYLLASVFGSIGIFATTQRKIQAIMALIILMLLFAFALVILEARKLRRRNV